MSGNTKKLLRQTTLEFSTSSRNKKRAPDSDVHTEKNKKKLKPNNSEVIDLTATDMDDEKKRKVLEAAEKRQDKKSPYFTISDASDTTDKNLNKSKIKITETMVTDEGGASCGVAVASTSSADCDDTKDTLKYEMSPELFTDSETGDDSQFFDSQDSACAIPDRKPSKLQERSSVWRGTRLSELNKKPQCQGKMPTLRSGKDHTVLFKVPYSYSPSTPPSPAPAHYYDRWDSDHVRMPCSKQNEYPVEGKGGKMELKRRWEMIEESLRQDIPGAFELTEAILKYNARYTNRWDFNALMSYFMEEMDEEETKYFFSKTLKSMIKLALQLPNLCTQPIPLLKKGKPISLTLSQQQVACLLANAFFCTFPRRNARQKNSEYSSYPDINFNNLFSGQPSKRKMEKLKCIMHYFTRVTQHMPAGVVTFTRNVIDKFPEWDKCDTTLRRLHVSAEGTIEDDGIGLLQADFANKYIGGGVLGHGLVQEEIRFLVCPEMIITRLFTEVLDNNECLLLTGCERFSDYGGYSDTFTWGGDYQDKTERDAWGRLYCKVVAIDALVIRDHKLQFERRQVKRELNKAYVGFYGTGPPQNLAAVCTGNWGCGAFGGDKRLKALIQLMAAAEARRDLCYFTFDDKTLRDELYRMHKYLTTDNHLNISNLLLLIDQYSRNVCAKTYRKPKKNLFEFIFNTFDGSLEDTDDEDNEHYMNDDNNYDSSDSLEVRREIENMNESMESLPQKDYTNDGNDEPEVPVMFLDKNDDKE